eukprot:gene2828-2055_t
MSAMKRKREEADSYPAKMDWSRSAIRSIATGVESPESSSNKPSYLLSDGSLLVISDDRLVFYADVLNRGLAELQQHDYSGLDEADSFSTELSIPSHARRRFFVRDSGKPRRNGELYPEVVCVSPGGSLQFWQPRKNGQHVTVCFTMLLADIERDEYIRDVLFEDGKVYLLSNLNNIYLVHRNDHHEVQGFLFQRSVSLIAGLWKTGARLLGVESEDRVVNALKLITVPQKALLLNVGSKLAIWSNYATPRRENVVLETHLSTVLKGDLAKALDTPTYALRFQLLDASVVAVTDSSADLFVLSALTSVSDNQQQRTRRDNDDGCSGTDDEFDFAGDVTASLRLHLIRVSFQPVDASSEASNVSIRRRYHVGDNVWIPYDESSVLPKLVTVAPGWRVFVTWTDATSQQLSAVQLDTFHGADASSVSETYVVRGPNGAMSAHVRRGEVSDVTHVAGVDGCVLVHSSPSQLTLFTPPLSSPVVEHGRGRGVRRDNDESIGVEGAEGALVGLALERASAQVFETLTNVIAHKADLFANLGGLRNAFLQLPADEALRIVTQVSEGIVNRNPTGRYWGSSLSSRGKSVDNKVNELQFAHRIVVDKVHCHSHFMQVVWEIYGFRHVAVRETLSLNQDRVALAAAVAEAIETRMGLLRDDDNVRLLLDVLTNVVEDTVLALCGQSLEDIQAKGLTPYDQFYADVTKVLEFLTHAVRALTASLQTTHWSPTLALYVLHCLVDVFHAAEANSTKAFLEYHAAADAQAEASSLQHLLLRHVPLRDALVAFVGALVPEVLAQSKGSSEVAARLFVGQQSSSTTGALPIGKKLAFGGLAGAAMAPEEQWVTHFAHLVLSAYVTQAQLQQPSADANASVEAMPRLWKQDYEQAKATMIALMLALHCHDRAFQFSQQFWFFEGLFEATAMAPAAHKAALDQLLRQSGHVRNSAVDAERTLLRQYLEWLERHGEHQRLLVDVEGLTAAEAASSSGRPSGAASNVGMIGAFLDGRELPAAAANEADDDGADAAVASTKVPFDTLRHHVHTLQGLRGKDYVTTARAALVHASTVSGVADHKTEQYLDGAGVLLAPLPLADEILQTTLVPLAEDAILGAANPAAELQQRRSSVVATASHIFIVLGYHHAQSTVAPADEAQSQRDTAALLRILSRTWQAILRLECLALEDAVLSHGPVTQLHEEALVRDVSLLAQVLQDALQGVSEGNLPLDFLWPIAIATPTDAAYGFPVDFATLLQQEVLSPGAERADAPRHPVVDTWKKAEHERAYFLITNITRLVHAARTPLS